MMAAVARGRVVIVGCGFGGLECAKKLDGSSVDVLVIDRNNFHVFTPLLYQVASSLLNPSDIAFPIRKIFRGSPNVRYRQGEVVEVDYAERRLRLHDGDEIAYDHLVLAPGTKTNFFGNKKLANKALGLKTLGEALQLRNHILICLEQASHLPRAQQEPWMTFVIVGGGPTGVEYAGALAELMRLVLEREYPDVAVPARIVLVEGGDRLLGMFPPRLSEYTRRRLERLGVEIVLDKLVKNYDGATVSFGDGNSLPAHTLVWSAGVKNEDITQGAPTADSRRVEVDGYCRMVGHPEVFAIGDAAGMTDEEGTVLPQLSAPAMQQGRYVGDFILQHGSSLDHLTGAGEPAVAPFRYLDKGSMAVIGRGHAVAKMGKLELTGFVGWLGWLVVHIYYLIGFRNRFLVLWQWMWTYFFYDRPVRIIARAQAEPVAQLPPAAAGRPPHSRRIM
jgi:NADH:ubiquinone reductase (H+-translocating)